MPKLSDTLMVEMKFSRPLNRPVIVLHMLLGTIIFFCFIFARQYIAKHTRFESMCLKNSMKSHPLNKFILYNLETKKLNIMDESSLVYIF